MDTKLRAHFGLTDRYPTFSQEGARVVEMKIAWQTKRDDSTVDYKHPDARLVRLIISLPGSEFKNSELQDVKTRLYSGGLAGILLGGGHKCSLCGSADATRSSARVVIYNWHSGTVLGVSGPLQDSRPSLTVSRSEHPSPPARFWMFNS